MSSVAERLQTLAGRTLALLPDSTTDEQASRFRDGHLMLSETGQPVPIKETCRDELARHLWTSLERTGGLLIAEDFNNHPTDPFPLEDENRQRWFSIDDEVYWWVDASGSEFEVGRALRDAGSAYLENTILVSDGERFIPAIRSGHLSPVDILGVCEDLLVAVVAAYDGESYVIWERS